MNKTRTHDQNPASSSGLTIWNEFVPAGTRHRIDLEFAKLPGQAQMSLPLEVVVGHRKDDEDACDSPGDAPFDAPCVWLSAAIHGDEINGMEIITQVLSQIDPMTLRGVLLAVPIVNIFGFALHNRYMPDRRDLNRSFPGSKTGSLTARLANLFFQEIVERSSHGIDLHTGSHHRINLPQVRTNLDDPEAKRMAQAFAAPVMIHGHAPDGSLRQVASERGVPIIVYEAGEAERFDQPAIALGVAGVLRVLHQLGMIADPPTESSEPSSIPEQCNLEVRKRTWIRAPASGIFGLQVALGDHLQKGDMVGNIHQPLGGQRHLVKAPKNGVVIGHSNHPLAYQGDALVHLARTN